MRMSISPCFQVLANILANAVKFTPSGEVVIHASCKPATLEGTCAGGNAGKQLVRVSIRDTGIGISEESMKKLFQCFRQGSESMSRRYGGTGSPFIPSPPLPAAKRPHHPLKGHTILPKHTVSMQESSCVKVTETSFSASAWTLPGH